MSDPQTESSPETPETPASPTYRHDRWGGLEHYTCLYCGHETWGEETLRLHMQRLHEGLMVEEVVPSMEEEPMGEPHDKPDKPEHPHGGPPGQTGEHPEHPHGGPPGQAPHPEHPQGGPPGQEPRPTHPIVEPDEEEDEGEEEETPPQG